jgi:cyanophycin synthetase
MSELQPFSAVRSLAEPMTVLETGVYRGPHYFSHTPFVRIMLDLGRMEDYPTDRIPGFTDRLVEMLPGLERHAAA